MVDGVYLLESLDAGVADFFWNSFPILCKVV